MFEPKPRNKIPTFENCLNITLVYYLAAKSKRLDSKINDAKKMWDAKLKY